MAEYINRADVLSLINTSDADLFNHRDNAEFQEKIKSLPTVDVVERKTGKWIEIRMGSINPLTGRASVYVGCSECHASIPSDSQFDFISESDCKFCYSCGAKMEVLIDV